MDENDSRESTHNSEADQAGLENNFTPRHQGSCSDEFDPLIKRGDDFCLGRYAVRENTQLKGRMRSSFVS
jgi:hypothetical protein